MPLRNTVAICLIVLCSLVVVTVAAAQTWIQLSPIGPTPPSGENVANYDAAGNRLIVYFPGNPFYDSSMSNQVWVLTNANGLGGTPEWTKLEPTGNPPFANIWASAVYDPLNNKLIIYGGGWGYTAPSLPNVFVLSNANGLGGTPEWAESTTIPPMDRDHHSAVYDPTSNRMIAFGGAHAFFGTTENDTRILFNANGSPSYWSTLVTSGGLPTVREGHSAIYDQTNNRMTVFGGNFVQCCYSSTYYNDVWVLSNANGLGSPTWTEVSPLGNLPYPRSEHSAVYDTVNNRMIIFGGYSYSDATGSSSVYGDVWQLGNANGLGGAPTWTQLITTGTSPGARQGQGTAFDAINQRMIVLGGFDSAGMRLPSNPVWILAFPITPCTSPTITDLNASPNVLWPPNHKMVPVKVIGTTSGGCGAVSCQIVNVSSNEPLDADGDWQITGSLTLNLRSDRLGKGSGRIYTITVQCTDSQGNSATKTTAVVVPHDQGK